jgi:hypothetical protein
MKIIIREMIVKDAEAVNTFQNNLDILYPLSKHFKTLIGFTKQDHTAFVAEYENKIVVGSALRKLL